MSAEHHSEHQERSEHLGELNEARREKLEELKHQPEKGPEDSKDRIEAARARINDEPEPNPEPSPESSAPSPRQPYIDHKLNYADTMRSLQKRLNPASRTFSKIIHTPIVEKTSEILENTVARPSVTLGSTLTALIVGSIFYLTAYHYGYMLSGSELLFSFIVGALLGVIIEGLLKAISRH